MGFIEDILGVVRRGPKTLDELNALHINTKTVAAGANSSTFQFPCLTSDTIPIDMASTMTQSLERVYASFVQSWLSLNPVIDISIDRTPSDYLKRFHQNVRLESAIEKLSIEPADLEGYMEKAYRGEYRVYRSKDNSHIVLFNVSDKPTRAMLESHRKYLKEYLSDFDIRPIYEADAGDVASSTYSAADLTREIISAKSKELAKRDAKDASQIYDKLKSPSMMDKDVKKTNDMMPYAMQVRLMAVNDAGQFVQYMDFIVGVKAILHPIKSDEIIVNIERVIQNKSVFFKLLRWTSGEISLFKNIILDLDTLKFDAMHRSDGRSPWFPRLKELKNKKFSVHSLSVPHKVIPNSSLIISAYEADWLNSRGINVRDAMIAKKIIDGLFLMTFVILDDSTGTVDILYNDSTAFQTYSLESLEREISMNSNKLGKEIGRMISR